MDKKTVFVLIAIMAIGVGSAALLSYFGVLNGTIEVSQSITLTGATCDENSCAEALDVFGGETITTTMATIGNLASVDIPIELQTAIAPDDGGIEEVTNIFSLEAIGVQ